MPVGIDANRPMGEHDNQSLAPISVLAPVGEIVVHPRGGSSLRRGEVDQEVGRLKSGVDERREVTARAQILLVAKHRH